MIVEVCFAISAMLGIYNCDYTAQVVSNETLQQLWQGLDGKGNINGFFNPNTKEIWLNDWKYFNHEWRHAFCENWWIYHMQHNNERMCENYPHFKIQR